MYTRIKQLYREPESYIGKTVMVGAWVRTVRDSKALGFIELHDGSFFKTLQVVVEVNIFTGDGCTQDDVHSAALVD